MWIDEAERLKSIQAFNQFEIPQRQQDTNTQYACSSVHLMVHTDIIWLSI